MATVGKATSGKKPLLPAGLAQWLNPPRGWWVGGAPEVLAVFVVLVFSPDPRAALALAVLLLGAGLGRHWLSRPDADALVRDWQRVWAARAPSRARVEAAIGPILMRVGGGGIVGVVLQLGLSR